jgi:hypothetical protein
MKDAISDFNPSLADLGRSVWMDRLDEIAEEYGAFDPLGPDHQAAFIDAGRTLVVTFETVQNIRRTEDAEPLGFKFTRDNGWSSLNLISEGDTWFRHRAVYGYFDRLVDDGFFEDFDQVVFYGAGSCGYAAAAFSVVAPGAQVIAVRPQATLDPQLTSWDRRFPQARAHAFDDRYGYAPDMIEGVDRAFIVFDPIRDADAMHASLFKRTNTTFLRCANMDERLEKDLDGMKILTPMIEAAMDGTLDAARFATLYRARRRHLPYLRNLTTRFENAGRNGLLAHVCRFATTDQKRPYFQKRLDALAELAAPNLQDEKPHETA